MHTSAANMKASLQTVTSWALLLLWTPGFSSKAVTDCGYAAANGKALVVNGKNATVSEFPWHVGLYMASRGMKQVCGGSLVLPRVVITAAHCLYYGGEYGKLVETDDLKVSVGSPFRDWSIKPQEVQRRNVSRLFPHPRFRGRPLNYANDIAIIELESPITLNAYVVPVCVDWENKDVPSLSGDSVGKVVGWGFRGAHDHYEPSPTLLSKELSLIPYEQCADKVPKKFLPFLSNDKFCAVHINGSEVSIGDSGEGLAFQHAGLWYLMGVVSVGRRADRQSYVMITSVGDFSRWIGQVIETITGVRQWPPPGPPAGSAPVKEMADEPPSSIGCGRVTGGPETLVVNGTKAEAGAFPWHAALYLRQPDGELKFMCGASLISSTVLITAAHCVYFRGAARPASLLAIGLGKLYSDWDAEYFGVHESNVTEVVVHPDYVGLLGKFAADIAVLHMEKAAPESQTIAPVCLGGGAGTLLRPGNYITVVGWGNGSTPLAELESVNIPYLARRDCLHTLTKSRPQEVSYITSDKFCAIRETGVVAPGGVAGGDSGGGVVVQRNSRWYLLGIVSHSLDDGRISAFINTTASDILAWVAESS